MQSHLLELRPYWNSRVRCENVRRKADIPVLLGNLAHDAKGLLTISFGFPWVSENDIECNVYSGELCLAGRVYHVVDTFVFLIHQREHIFGRRFRAKPHVIHATLAEQSHIIFAHPRHKVGGGLKVPIEFDATRADPLSNW